MKTLDRDRALITVLGVLILAALVVIALSSGVMGQGMMGGYGGTTHMGGWSGGMAIGSLGVLVLFGALIASVFLFIRKAPDQRRANWGEAAADPMAMLQRRYAMGEIDQATYERLKQELKV